MQAFLDWLVADFYVYGTPIQHGAAVVVVMLAFIPITLLPSPLAATSDIHRSINSLRVNALRRGIRWQKVK